MNKMEQRCSGKEGINYMSMPKSCCRIMGLQSLNNEMEVAKDDEPIKKKNQISHNSL